MGGAPSSTASASKVASHANPSAVLDMEKEIIPFVMPIYYTTAPILPIELEAATKAWKMILNNRCENFNRMKKEQNPTAAELENATEFFFHVFYERLFDIHPGCRKLFTRSIHKQGSFFLRFFSMCIAEIDEPEKLEKTLENLTNIHNKMGVKAVEYGIAGEAIFYTLRRCLGPDVYTDSVHSGWTKIYSLLLRGIIPHVVRFELRHKDQSAAIADKREGHSVAKEVFSKHESVSAAANV